MNGEPWAISQVADRIDGKATAEIQTEQRHRYVIEAPAQLTREQWIEKYSPKTISSSEANPALPDRGRPTRNGSNSTNRFSLKVLARQLLSRTSYTWGKAKGV
jgi:hypothetical protein